MRGVLVAIDLETTGLLAGTDRIIEVGAVKFQGRTILERYETLIDPEIPIPSKITALTGIDQAKIAGKPKLVEVLPRLKAFIGDAPVVGHNIEFDVAFLQKAGLLDKHASIDTYELASVLLPTTPRYNLNALMQELHLAPDGEYHRALADSVAASQVYAVLWEKLLTELPLSVLHEIVTAAKPLNWKGWLPFYDALQERLENGEKLPDADSSPAVTSPSMPPAAQTSVVSAASAPVALDMAQLTTLMSSGGVVATALPNYEERPAQIEMLKAAAESFNENQHRLIEAAPGTGRALAYLLPAAQWALQNGERVVIAVASDGHQAQILDRELPLLQQVLGQPIRVAVMKTRSSYLCPRRLNVLRRRQPTSLDELRVFAKVSVWLAQYPDLLEADALSLRGPDEQSAWFRLSAEGEACHTAHCEAQMNGICPFFKASQAAEQAHLLIVNHRLLIADAESDTPILPPFERVIVDAAHRLEESITYGQSFRLDPLTISRQLADLGNLKSGLLGDMIASTREALPPDRFEKVAEYIAVLSKAIKIMPRHVESLFSALRAFLETVQSSSNNGFPTLIRLSSDLRKKPAFSQVTAAWSILGQFIEELAATASKLLDGLNRLSERYPIANIDDLLSGAAATARHLSTLHDQLAEVIVDPDNNTIYWVETNSDTVALHGAPLNVGPLAQQALWADKKTVILTDAILRTGSSFEFVRQRLRAISVRETAVAGRHDYSDSLMMYLPSDMPEPQEKARYNQAVEEGLIKLADATGGRMMVIFNGYTQLRQVAQNISPRLALGSIAIFDQSDGTSRQSLLEGFKNTPRAVLFGTRSLWYDSDLELPNLAAMVVVRLPFAVPSDPIFSARSELYDDTFNQFTVPDAVGRFREMVDQLIRLQPQKGIIAVFDKRLISKEYGQNFLESLPKMTTKRQPMSEIGTTAKEWLGERG